MKTPKRMNLGIFKEIKKPRVKSTKESITVCRNGYLEDRECASDIKIAESRTEKPAHGNHQLFQEVFLVNGG